ncbi:sirohydrochlorin chelatase [Williamsia sp. MIQD14]|uniref:sirohydrochlorin chelatase n=1 Tax=Williamsia sp. MIQD14 TaxID=3425703 RepID=UPI003DA07C82
MIDPAVPQGFPAGVTPIVVAHGTRSSVGVATVAAIAELVAARVGPTRVAFVDVLGPSPTDVLRDLDGPAVVVPAFLASGYHVRVDLPDHIREVGRENVAVAPALGPDPVIAGVLLARLREAGWRPGDAVVLAAAGSSDPDACADVRRAADMLADLTGDHVDVGYVTTASPAVPDAVAAARGRGAQRVIIASYLLAPGLFHTRLAGYGADAVAEPLGADPAIADLVVARLVAAALPATVH